MTNQMPPDDPRLTAYALGETDDPALAAALAHDEALRAEVEAIRTAAGLLSETFQDEPALGLTPEQRAEVVAAGTRNRADQPAAGKLLPFPRRVSVTPQVLFATASAAVIVLAIGWALTEMGPSLFVPTTGASLQEPKTRMTDKDLDLMSGQAAGRSVGPAAAALATAPALSADAAVTAEPLYLYVRPTSAAESSATEPPAAGAADLLDGRAADIVPALEEDNVIRERRRLGLEPPYLPARPMPNTEDYAPITDNPFQPVSQAPLSTFSIDVDTASYANVRRFLQDGQLPPPDAVRIEELVNYFKYDYPGPTGDAPFGASIAVARAPWAPEHRLVRIGLKGRDVPMSERPASNLVFLVDVSGSMDEPDKLPLVKEALRGLVTQLDARDRVTIVTYAGESGLALPPTSGVDKWALLGAIDRLSPGGGTNGGGGIQMAYDEATRSLIPGGTNRVILATDGDFNVGITDQDALTRLIEDEARRGVFLSVLGFGTGNLKDSTMEMLADKGNGNYAYIDAAAEARKVLGEQLAGTLLTIAKDVKAQVEFNPAKVSAYRLIGYENRVLAAEDFNNDAKDAGEIGSGHTVTALYEVVPVGVEVGAPGVDPLRYQAPPVATPETRFSDELMTLKLRYKDPEGDTSRLLTFPVRDGSATIDRGPGDFQLAAAVAAFGMLLRDSPYRGAATFDMVRQLATRGLLATDDRNSADGAARSELLGLVDIAQRLKGGA